MKRYKVEQIRNVGLFSHGGSGKTTLAEAMLFTCGATDRQGRVDEGNTIMDYDPDEIKRKITIYSSLAPCEWKDHKLNVLDTPGFLDFVAEVIGAMRVMDSALILVAANAGVEVGTEKVWAHAEENNLPRMLFVNKLDKEHADFRRTLSQIQEKLSNKAVAVQLPVGSEESFNGVVDLISRKTYVFEKEKVHNSNEAPAALKDQVEELREKLVEAAAETDDDLLSKYLDSGELTDEEIRKGLQGGIASGKIFPVLCGSAFKNIAVSTLLDFLREYSPSPVSRGPVSGKNPKSGQEETRKPAESEPFSALVFKTTADPFVGKLTYFRVFSGILKSDTVVYNASREREEKLATLFIMKGKHQDTATETGPGDIVTVAKLQETVTGDTLCTRERPILFPPIDFPAPVQSLAVMPKSKGDEDKLGSALSRLTEEDPTFKVRRDTEVKQTIISGMGELHLENTVDRLKRKFGVDVTLEPPKIPYKETIKGKTQIEGKYKRQSGGRGQYGHCWLELEPLPRGGNFEFVDKIVGGVIPKNYIPSVEKGVRDAMEEGILAGYPLVDVRVKVYDGSYHTVDSSDMAFKIAGSMALRKGALEANPVLLEPVAAVEVTVPENFMGDVIGDLNGKRGRILGMEPLGKGLQLIRANVPVAEMQRYSIDLRSITQARGSFKTEFSHYEEVPHLTAEGIIGAYKAQKEEKQ